MSKKSWLTTSRRRLLGHLLVGSGAFLTGCGLNTAGNHIKQKGKIRLNQSSSIPQGLQDLISFPLLEALMGRRSRRFPLGCSIPEGPLAYTSKKEPIPLTELEQMILLTAIAGNTGWQHLIPYNPNYTPNIPNYSVNSTGRTFPSAAGFHSTEFFYTDDNGTYFFPTRDVSLLNSNSNGNIELQEYLQAHRKQVKKLSDKRLHLPRTAQHMEMHNAWCANRPGSSLIIPVVDTAQHHLANLCYLVQSGACIYDDIGKKPIPGIEKFGSIVDTKNPYPLSYIEQMTLSEVTVEVSTSCYAGALMLQAMGLGGWTFAGLNPFSVLGASGDPNVPGLGFSFNVDERWPLPNVTGLPKIFEGLCPPHVADMREAVDAIVEKKFGKGGPYNPQTKGPYRNTAAVRKSGKIHDEKFKQCVTLMAKYIYDNYGRFPATFSSIFTMMYLQAHHIDLGYYDKHFGPSSYLKTHETHLDNWH